MNSSLEVFSDLSERLKYNLPDFPLYVRKGTLHQFPRYAAACHWHLDLEFISILNGAMEYFINGQTVHLDVGNGIFVNSKRFHYGFSTDRIDCSYLVVAVHPLLLGDKTHPGKMYLQEKFGTNTDDFLLLNSRITWQNENLHLMEQMYAEINREHPNPLRLLSQASSLCACTGDHIQPASGSLVENQSWITFEKMREFIHQHYDAKLSLDEIAAAGAICRSRCCQLFSKHIGQSPNAYLMGYRILKSCEMLQETKRSIGEIAIACGFQTASYFSYAFHRGTGIVPQDYRKQPVE